MTNKQIKKLALLSYTKNNIDSNKVNKILKLFSRGNLKTYIKVLKNLERERTLFVIVPSLSKKNLLSKYFQKIFPDKKILFQEDKSLIAGIKIINKDDVIDFNIKNSLENLISYIAR